MLELNGIECLQKHIWKHSGWRFYIATHTMQWCVEINRRLISYAIHHCQFIILPIPTISPFITHKPPQHLSKTI